MAAWFRKGLSPHQTALAMVGAKPGDVIAVVGAGDVELAAELALVTGLNGQTTVCDAAPDAKERVTAAAGQAGALVEFEAVESSALPFGDGTCDIVVILAHLEPLDDTGRQRTTAEAVRVLRPGGRVVILDGDRSNGLLAGFRRPRRRLPADQVLLLLERAGTKARRQLADANGVAYYEARKAAP